MKTSEHASISAKKMYEELESHCVILSNMKPYLVLPQVLVMQCIGASHYYP